MKDTQEGASNADSCPLCDGGNKPKLKVAINVVPARPKTHKWRANQTVAYHRRIQKKWNKRFHTKGDLKVYEDQVSQLYLPKRVVEQLLQYWKD